LSKKSIFWNINFHFLKLLLILLIKLNQLPMDMDLLNMNIMDSKKQILLKW